MEITFKSSVWINIFIILVFLASSGCGPSYNDPEADHSFLTDEPCKAPCWLGLELDKSNEKEIVERLKELPFIETSKIYTFPSSWLGDNSAREIGYDCLHPKLEFCGALRVSGDKLKLLRYKLGYRLTLETVVSKLGPPDYIEAGPIHPEIGGCDLTLFWPGQKIIAGYINEKAEPLCNAIEAGEKIPPDIFVTNLTYSVNEGFGPLPGGCCTRVPWPGFSEP